MSDDEQRAIGRLEGKMDFVVAKVKELDKKVNKLSVWKVKATAVIATLWTVAALVVKYY